ncbi:hypothetical protein HMPREF9996_01007 [Aggregatibacter actinomycetemcomitans Y4]|nr:hypothetical protein HMPREF9996_01007 [Aggregatibacter actinomycetemcomitans Y4]
MKIVFIVIDLPAEVKVRLKINEFGMPYIMLKPIPIILIK